MSKRILKKAKCAKCSNLVEYTIVVNDENDLSLSSFNLFKTIELNMCPNCFYVNTDLEENNELFSSCCYNKKTVASHEDKIALLECHYKNLINPLEKLRTKANQFTLEKFLFNESLIKNYRSIDEKKLEELDKLKIQMQTTAKEILSLIDENEQTDLVTCLKIEVLACLGDTKKANGLLEKIKPTGDLLEELQKCIMLGGDD